MPFQSKSQMGWMFANKPKMAKQWADETPNIKALPQNAIQAGFNRIAKKKKKNAANS